MLYNSTTETVAVSIIFFFFSSRRRHTRCSRDWSSDVCSSDLKSRASLKGMSAYGLDCVVNALKRPLAQIVENAGYNPLEKVENVVAAQNEKKSDSLGIDCETGEICDMVKAGLIDPAPVKLHALKAA